MVVSFCVLWVMFHYMSVWEKAHLKLNYNSWYFSLQWTIYVNIGRRLCECLITCLKKAHIRTRIIGIFHFHLLFLKTLIKNIIYCQIVHLFVRFTYVLVCKKVCQASLSSLLLLTIFCLDLCQMEIACLTEHLWHLWEITHCHINLEWWQLLRYI